MAVNPGPILREMARALVKDGADAMKDYKAGRINREEFHRRDPMGAAYTEIFEGTDKDEEYKAIRRKLNAEYDETTNKQQLLGMKADLARDRGFSWVGHRMWSRCRKELEDEGNATLLKAMADAEIDPRRKF